jgi:hypothetical protein
MARIHYRNSDTMKHLQTLSKACPAPARLPNEDVSPKVDRILQMGELLRDESPKVQIKNP